YPHVSVLVPAYNEEDSIENTIISLLKVKYNADFKIIVINDGSKDNTIKVLEKYKEKITIIDKKKNAGKAAAINSGLKLVKTEFVAIVDADSQVSPSSLENSIKHFYVEGGEDIGAVISKMR